MTIQALNHRLCCYWRYRPLKRRHAPLTGQGLAVPSEPDGTDSTDSTDGTDSTCLLGTRSSSSPSKSNTGVFTWERFKPQSHVMQYLETTDEPRLLAIVG